MRIGNIAAITIALLASAGCASVAPPVAAASAQAPSMALAALFEASDEANLKRNPLSGVARGDLRYADRLGDYLSDAYYAAERRAAEQELAALARIDRAALNASERISYDVFKWQRELDLRGLQPDMLALTAVRPIDHFNGFHTCFAEISTGDSVAPFKTVKDYDNGLSRDRRFRYRPRSVDRAHARGHGERRGPAAAGDGQCRRAARRDACGRRRGQQLHEAAQAIPGEHSRRRSKRG